MFGSLPLLLLWGRFQARVEGERDREMSGVWVNDVRTWGDICQEKQHQRLELAQEAMDAVNGRAIWPEVLKFLGAQMVPP